MAIIRKSPPYGYVIFAEDIRSETGGTFSLIGVPPMGLAVPSFPAMLPRFAVSISYAEAPGESEDDITFAMFGPGSRDPVWQAKVDLAFRKALPRPDLYEGGFDQSIVGLTMNTGFSPFVVQQAGIVRVVALRGGDQINLGSLPFVLADTSAAPSPPGDPMRHYEADKEFGQF